MLTHSAYSVHSRNYLHDGLNASGVTHYSKSNYKFPLLQFERRQHIKKRSHEILYLKTSYKKHITKKIIKLAHNNIRLQAKPKIKKTQIIIFNMIHLTTPTLCKKNRKQ